MQARTTKNPPIARRVLRRGDHGRGARSPAVPELGGDLPAHRGSAKPWPSSVVFALCSRGKSTAVSLLMNKAIESDPKLRILILDPHNEFAAAFPQKAVVIDTDTLDLPFWLFRLEELAEVLYRGRPRLRLGDDQPRLDLVAADAEAQTVIDDHRSPATQRLATVFDEDAVGALVQQQERAVREGNPRRRRAPAFPPSAPRAHIPPRSVPRA